MKSYIADGGNVCDTNATTAFASKLAAIFLVKDKAAQRAQLNALIATLGSGRRLAKAHENASAYSCSALDPGIDMSDAKDLGNAQAAGKLAQALGDDGGEADAIAAMQRDLQEFSDAFAHTAGDYIVLAQAAMALGMDSYANKELGKAKAKAEQLTHSLGPDCAKRAKLLLETLGGGSTATKPSNSSALPTCAELPTASTIGSLVGTRVGPPHAGVSTPVQGADLACSYKDAGDLGEVDVFAKDGVPSKAQFTSGLGPAAAGWVAGRGLGVAEYTQSGTIHGVAIGCGVAVLTSGDVAVFLSVSRFSPNTPYTSLTVPLSGCLGVMKKLLPQFPS